MKPSIQTWPSCFAGDVMHFGRVSSDSSSYFTPHQPTDGKRRRKRRRRAGWWEVNSHSQKDRVQLRTRFLTKRKKKPLQKYCIWKEACVPRHTTLHTRQLVSGQTSTSKKGPTRINTQMLQQNQGKAADIGASTYSTNPLMYERVVQAGSKTSVLGSLSGQAPLPLPPPTPLPRHHQRRLAHFPPSFACWLLLWSCFLATLTHTVTSCCYFPLRYYTEEQTARRL